MTVTRRQFLIGLAGTGAATALGACASSGDAGTAGSTTIGGGSGPSPSTATTLASGRGRATDDGILVVLTLYGGNDGLDTVIPATDSAYRAARGALARDPATVLDLGDGLGLHPALKQVKAMWDQRSLAIVRGVGFDDLDRSHFHCMDMWQSGGDHHAVSGWLGRWLDTQPPDPLRAIAIGNDLPLLLRGTKASGSLVPLGPAKVPGGGEVAARFADLSKPRPGAPALLQAAATAGTDMLAVASRIASATAAATPDDDPVDGGGAAKAGGDAGGGAYGGGLTADLDLVARLIAADLPTRVYAVSMGGFDTHTSEAGTHDRLMAELDAGLGSFLAKVGERPVTVVAYTEFGRRVALNSSGGTDHGTAGPVFVCGPVVQGGFFGEEPGLTDLVDGDLKHNVDFRSLYTTVLNGVLGVDADVAIADGGRYRPLPLLA